MNFFYFNRCIYTIRTRVNEVITLIFMMRKVVYIRIVRTLKHIPKGEKEKGGREKKEKKEGKTDKEVSRIAIGVLLLLL